MFASPSPALPPFAALRAFAMVGRMGGIRKAAEALGVSHAIVSRHLSALEEALGVMLLKRQTGQLTEVGEAYHARIAAAIGELEQATQMVRGQRGAALTILCSAGFSLHWLARRLPSFSNRTQGHKAPPVIDLRSTDGDPTFAANQADGDVRYVLDSQPIPEGQSVRTIELARPEVYPVASPSFVAALREHPACIADLLALPRIEESLAAEWAAWAIAQGKAPSLAQPVARYGQAHLTLAAARAGQGLALSNDYLASEDLRDGRLVRTTPAQEPLLPVTLGAYLFRAPRSRWSDPMLVQFRHWLIRAVALDETN